MDKPEHEAAHEAAVTETTMDTDRTPRDDDPADTRPHDTLPDDTLTDDTLALDDEPVTAPAAASTPAPEPVLTPAGAPVPEAHRHGIRVGTVVWGLVLAAIGVGLLAAASGVSFDVELAVIGLVAAAGLALLVGSIATSVRRSR